MLKLHCPHQTPADVANNLVNVVNNAQSPMVNEIVGDDGTVQFRHGNSEQSNENVLYVVLVTLQTTIFVVLMFAAVAIYQPLSVPTSIPLSTRINNVIANIPVSYPMMAYFSRDSLLNSDTPPRNVAALLHACIRSEGFALLATLFFTILLGIPGFLMQLALADTPLSSDNRSIIGLVISIVLGIFMFKRGRKAAQTGMISKRNIPEEYAAHLAS
ncbi:transmembrane protein, putative [Bodo saltans]|uniref:Transmembrane protein, putative n=1 Tax=Bodo saltans TaxID=75058 RepID=A0A0S4JDS2_BODSA|nr:transmembrane protein, putative [Bodo saltans]|eukprot:CUG88602.1 transmembrane protein, putative [Bodo saltans]